MRRLGDRSRPGGWRRRRSRRGRRAAGANCGKSGVSYGEFSAKSRIIMAGMKQVVTLPMVLLLTAVFASAKVPPTGSEARIKELQRERSKLEKTSDPVDR